MIFVRNMKEVHFKALSARIKSILIAYISQHLYTAHTQHLSLPLSYGIDC